MFLSRRGVRMHGAEQLHVLCRCTEGFWQVLKFAWEFTCYPVAGELSATGLETRAGAGPSGVRTPVRQRSFSLLRRSRLDFGSSAGVFLGDKGGGTSTPIYLMPRLRTSGTMPLFPQPLSWRVFRQIYFQVLNIT